MGCSVFLLDRLGQLFGQPCVARSASGAPPRPGSVVCAPVRPASVWRWLNELISSFWLGQCGELPPHVGTGAAGPAGDLREESYEKSRMFGGFGAPSAFELCGRLQRGTSQTQFHSHQSIWRYKNSARIKHSYHDVICAQRRCRWHTCCWSTPHCLPWRAAAARSDGGLHA